jgi:hypothetical protein
MAGDADTRDGGSGIVRPQVPGRYNVDVATQLHLATLRVAAESESKRPIVRLCLSPIRGSLNGPKRLATEATRAHPMDSTSSRLGSCKRRIGICHIDIYGPRS